MQKRRHFYYVRECHFENFSASHSPQLMKGCIGTSENHELLMLTFRKTVYDPMFFLSAMLAGLYKLKYVAWQKVFLIVLRETADHCKHELFGFSMGPRRFLPTHQSGEGDLCMQNLSRPLNSKNLALNLGAAGRKAFWRRRHGCFRVDFKMSAEVLVSLDDNNVRLRHSLA